MVELGKSIQKKTEKNDPRLISEQQKLDAVIPGVEDLTIELKKDLPAVLKETDEFLIPLFCQLILLQNNFTHAMTIQTTALVGTVDHSFAVAREPRSVITPRETSSITRSYVVKGLDPYGNALDQTPTASKYVPTLGTDPYANDLGGPKSAAPASDPYASAPGANPYASAPGASNPYASAPVAANPYASAPASNPYASPPAAANPYASPPASNPYASAPGASVLPVPPPAPVALPPPPAAHALPQARANWQFAATNPQELSFQAGDVLTIHERTGDWWKAELHGRQGLIPGNYVVLL